MLDISSVCLATPEGGMLELDKFRRLIRQALIKLSRFRVLQDDVCWVFTTLTRPVWLEQCGWIHAAAPRLHPWICTAKNARLHC